jgi:hypothetical protein
MPIASEVYGPCATRAATAAEAYAGLLRRGTGP